MQYITYCKTCNAITGHLTHGLRSSCMKCNTDKKTPVLRWVAGTLLGIALTAMAVWIIYNSFIVLLTVLS